MTVSYSKGLWNCTEHPSDGACGCIRGTITNNSGGVTTALHEILALSKGGALLTQLPLLAVAGNYVNSPRSREMFSVKVRVYPMENKFHETPMMYAELPMRGIHLTRPGLVMKAGMAWAPLGPIFADSGFSPWVSSAAVWMADTKLARTHACAGKFHSISSPPTIAADEMSMIINNRCVICAASEENYEKDADVPRL